MRALTGGFGGGGGGLSIEGIEILEAIPGMGICVCLTVVWLSFTSLTVLGGGIASTIYPFSISGIPAVVNFWFCLGSLPSLRTSLVSLSL